MQPQTGIGTWRLLRETGVSIDPVFVGTGSLPSLVEPTGTAPKGVLTRPQGVRIVFVFFDASGDPLNRTTGIVSYHVLDVAGLPLVDSLAVLDSVLVEDVPEWRVVTIGGFQVIGMSVQITALTVPAGGTALKFWAREF